MKNRKNLICLSIYHPYNYTLIHYFYEIMNENRTNLECMLNFSSFMSRYRFDT